MDNVALEKIRAAVLSDIDEQMLDLDAAENVTYEVMKDFRADVVVAETFEGLCLAMKEYAFDQEYAVQTVLYALEPSFEGDDFRLLWLTEWDG